MKTQRNKKSEDRLFYLDNLRIYLTILVILHHTAIAYGGAGDWPVKDPSVDILSPSFLTFFNALNQSYFMSAFFLLAGYFTPSAIERKGAGYFLKDRLIRLGIPIIAYTSLIININQVVLGVWMRGRPFRWLFIYHPGHLWFLQALLLFAVIYILYRIVMNRNTFKQRLRFYSDHFPSDGVLILSIIFLTILTFAVRIKFPVGKWVFPGFQLAHFVHYAFSFFVGILAYHGDWFNNLHRDQARHWGIVVLIMLPLFFVPFILGRILDPAQTISVFIGGLHWQSFTYTAWESVMLIAVMIFLLYLFRARFNRSSPLRYTMAASVYTVYIIHQTVLVTFNILFLPVEIPTILKLCIVSLIVLPLCFGLAVLIRKIPYAKRVLG
jgi:surface polysaccharide O-acyltransferase-like enzyme